MKLYTSPQTGPRSLSRVFVLVPFLGFLVSSNLVVAQQTHGSEDDGHSGMEISKQQFIDMSLNMAEKSGKLQASMKQKQEHQLRQEMGQEKFEKFQAENQKTETAREEKLANCLGISHKKLKSFEKTMDIKFQMKAIEQCKYKLPDMISMTDAADPTRNSALSDYTECLEGIAVKQTGISADKIQNCAAQQIR